jgi:uncharacterized repeat protein (TIGR01451 family)
MLPLPTPSKYLAHYKTLHLHMKNIYFLTLAVLFFTATYLSAQINWQSTNGPEGASIGLLDYNDSYAFYPDEYHLFRTADGVSWEQLPVGNLWPLRATNDKIAGVKDFRSTSNDSKLVVSYDNGNTWTQENMPSKKGFYSIGNCSHGIYIPNGAEGLIYKTTDDGLTWDTFPAPALYCYDIWSTDNRLFTGTTSKIWRLAADGVTWESFGPGLGAQESVRHVFADDNLLFLATQNRIWSSQDFGFTWIKKEISYTNNESNFIRIGNRIYKVAGGTGLLYTDDFGISWVEYPVTEKMTPYKVAQAGGRLLAISYNQGVFYLNLANNTWQPTNTGLNSAVVYDLALSNDRLWVASGNSIASYNLNDQDWNNDNTLPFPEYNYQNLVVSPAGVVAANAYFTHELFVSKDNGATWQIKTTSGDPSFGLILGNIFWVGENLLVCADFGFSSKLSKDYGQTWENASINSVLDIVYFNNLHYAVNETAVFTSQDQGITWTVLNFPNSLSFYRLFTAGDRLLGLTDDNRLYTTTDGVNWSPSEGLPQFYQSDDLGSKPSGSFWYYDNRYFFQKVEIGMYASLDSCKTWLPIAPHLDRIVLKDSTFYSSGGFGGGVLKTGIPTHYSAVSSGTVFSDKNGNGILDASESVLSNIRIELNESNAWYPFWFTQTQQDGHYNLVSLPGVSDTIRPRIFSPYVLGITPPYHAVSNSGSNRDFAVRFTENITDGGIKHLSVMTPRPGFDHSIRLSLENIGTLSINGNVGVKLDPKFSYLNADPVPTAIMNGDSLIWDIAQFNLFETRQINIAGKIATSAPLGSLLKTNSTLTVNGIDQDITNNHFVSYDTIRGSNDPNEKRVEPSNGLTKAEIEAGKPLIYTIYFQNTGTYEADRVRITDKLDTALNWPTLRLLQASHEVSSFNLLPGGLLEVVFNHIALPDSNSNEPGSHGFVQFSIERNKQFDQYGKIENRASIYFDFNDPIITNTVTIRLATGSVAVSEPAGTKGGGSPALDISPNPANAYFMVHTLNLLRGQGEFQVIDLNGRVCQRQKVADCAAPIRVETAGMASGIYLVRVADAQGAMVGKVDVKVDK